MKYVDEFRDRELIEKVADRIRRAADAGRTYKFMEVCGTHTMNIFRFGLKSLLPAEINLISGPGCPVCVTPNEYIDKAVALSRMKDVTIATFGDMYRVPGSRSSLEKEKAAGAVIRTVYSTDDALRLARNNARREIVFLGVGFETTAPTVAQALITARKDKIDNFSVLCGHKTMPEALRAMVASKETAVDGFLLPGHVSAVIGPGPYRFLTGEYRKRCVIAGFEPLDIMQAILMLIRQDKPKVGIQYTRIIGKKGNDLALKSIKKVFRKVTSEWRGIGKIEDSGLAIKGVFRRFDAEKKFDIRIAQPSENKRCICGEVLKGLKRPTDCGLFGKRCKPETPVGACMISSEGTCAAYYKFRVNS